MPSININVKNWSHLIIYIILMRENRVNSSRQKYMEKTYSMEIQIKPKDVINLWLLNILPPAPSFKVKIDLKHMSVQGQKEACIKFCDKIYEYKQKHVFKVIQDEKEIHKKCLKEIQNKFQCEVFKKEEIIEIYEYLVKNYDFTQIKQFSKRESSNYYYSCSIEKHFSKEFDIYISELSQDSVQSSQESCSDENIGEQQQGYSGDDAEYQKNYMRNKRAQYIEKKKKQQFSNSKYSEKKDREIVIEQQYPIQIISKRQIQQWISKNQALRKTDFKIIQNRQKKTIRIIYQPEKKFNTQRKMIIVNRFFKFQKVFLPKQNFSKKDYEKIADEFCLQSQNFISCSIVNGYWSPNINQNQLRKRISRHQINKTSKYSKESKCIHIEGLQKMVKQKYRDIQEFIQNLEKQNVIEEIKINIEELEPYLYDKRVIKLSEQICFKIFEKIKTAILLEVCVTGKILTLKVELKEEDQFKTNDEERINQQIRQDLQILEIEDKNKVSIKLKDEFILLPSKSNSEKIVLIARKAQSSQYLMKILNQIRQNQKLITENLLFPTIFFCRIKEFEKKEFKEYPVKFMYQKKQAQTQMTFACSKILAQRILLKIKEYLSQMQSKMLTKQIQFSDDQFNIVYQNQERMKKSLEQKYKISLDIAKNVNKGCLITVGNHITPNPFDMPIVLLIKRNNKLSELPPKTLILFRKKDQVSYSKESFLNPFKNCFQTAAYSEKVIRNDEKDFYLLYSEKYVNIETFISKFTEKNMKKFAFIMPKKEKKTFIINLLQSAEQVLINENKKLQLFVFDNSQQNLEEVLELQKGHTIKKWYVQDQNEDFYYSEQGNKKIKRAEQRGDHKIILYNKDLNLVKITHRLSYQQKKLFHWLNQVQTDIQFNDDNSASVVLRNAKFKISKYLVQKWKDESENWQKQIHVSLGIYHIDLNTEIQTNLFTGFQRKLEFKKYQNQRFLAMSLFQNYNFQKNQVNLYYQKNENMLLLLSINLIKEEIHKLKIMERVKINLDDYDDKKIQFIEKIADENKITTEVDKASSELILTGFDKSAILTFIKMLPLLEKVPSVQYPETWQEQKEDIQTFQVDKKSDQFKEVQKAFSYNIQELCRIQNKPIYKKYFEEKMFLKSLNGGKNVKEMKLYHGTGNTDPKVIYEDRQECFNINYTSDKNYLGRGTYFAQQSIYSNLYSFQDQNINQVNAFHQMFYCAVLVGDSQNIADVTPTSRSMKDTDFKDTVNKIRYESSTMFSNGSQIYAVYKNRRAYPLYLIKY